MIARQPMRSHQHLLLFHPKLLPYMLEEIQKVLPIRLVRPNILRNVSSVELHSLQGARERGVEGSDVAVRQGDELVVLLD